MLPRIRALVPFAALAVLLAAPAAAQDSTPAGRGLTVSTGMTTAQATAVLGAPARTRVQGRHTFLYYPAGCEGCAEDYLVIRDCRVVDARLEAPGRAYLPAGLPEGTPATPPQECTVSTAAASGPAAGGAAPEPLRPPERPRDTDPRGALPAEQPPLARPADTGVDAAQTTSPEEWRARLRLGGPDAGITALPAASVVNPTALGMERGQAYVGLGYQVRTRFTDQDDAAVAIGVGIGDRARYFALEGTVLSYSTLRGGGPFETGGVGFKLHRALGESGSIAVGTENLHTWGGSDAGRSSFAVGTYAFRRTDDPAVPFNAITASLGVGDGRFRSEDDVTAGNDSWNVFGSVSLQVAAPVSLVADWTGQDLFAGVSFTPIPGRPLVLNLSLADVAGTAGDGVRPVMSIVYGFVLPHSFR
ncbi:MAG TPA: hypothetical protein VEW03_01485 [Longimicrobiaceae bacterium]|nr:hypothetical protein [Longimicrobiaceae bacterium]